MTKYRRMAMIAVLLVLATFCTSGISWGKDEWDRYKDNVFFVLCTDGKKLCSGTAWVVGDTANATYLITCAHVVSTDLTEKGTYPVVAIFKNKSLRSLANLSGDELRKNGIVANVEKIDTPNDIALIKVGHQDGVKPLVLGKGDELTTHLEVMALGYPMPDRDVEYNSLQVTAMSGHVTVPDRTTELQTTREFEHDCNIDHGASGGPILNMKTKHVLGIVRRGRKDKVTLATRVEPIASMMEPYASSLAKGDSVDVPTVASSGEVTPAGEVTPSGEITPIASPTDEPIPSPNGDKTLLVIMGCFIAILAVIIVAIVLKKSKPSIR